MTDQNINPGYRDLFCNYYYSLSFSFTLCNLIDEITQQCMAFGRHIQQWFDQGNFNLLWSIDLIWQNIRSRSSLYPIVACCLISTNPLSEPILINHHKIEISWRIALKFRSINRPHSIFCLKLQLKIVFKKPYIFHGINELNYLIGIWHTIIQIDHNHCFNSLFPTDTSSHSVFSIFGLLKASYLCSEYWTITLTGDGLVSGTGNNLMKF